MKVGTLTLVYPDNQNYGAFLQGYALCRALNRLEGVSAICLPFYALDTKAEGRKRDYWQEATNRYRTAGYSGLAIYIKVLGYVLREPMKSWCQKFKEKTQRTIRFDMFSDLFQAKKPIFYEAQDLSRADVDVFVVGSDWVWYLGEPSAREGYLGKVNTDKPFFSYAASFGKLPSTRHEIAQVQAFVPNFKNLSCREREGVELLKSLGYEQAHWDVDPTLLLSRQEIAQVQAFVPNFKNLSCREREGVELLKSLGYEQAHWDVDPTLLLSRQDWKDVAEIPKEKDYIAVYWLPKSEIEYAGEEQLANYLNKCRQKFPTSQIIILNPQKLMRIDGENKSDIGPQDFIGYIANAKYVVTNSFHGCVFCALFNTRFTVFPRFNGDSRVCNFLTITQLKSRMISNADNKEDPLDIEINWSVVEQIIENQARRSINYLENILCSYETVTSHK